MAINVSVCATDGVIGLIGGKSMSEDELEVLVENILKLLKARGMSQAELSRSLGFNTSTISLKLAGKREFLMKDIIAIGRVLGVSASALLNPDLVPEGAELYSDPLKALEALARSFGRETRPKRIRKKNKSLEEE